MNCPLPWVVRNPETPVSLVQDLLGLLLDTLSSNDSSGKRRELKKKIKGLVVR